MRRLVLTTLASLAVLTAAPAAASAEPVFVVGGRGWGHGVGMSQWGARGYAERGFRWQGILAHYYPGTRLGAAPVSRLRVLLAAGRPRLRIGSKRPFRVVDARGRRAVLPAGFVVLRPRLVVRVKGNPVRLVSPVRFQPGPFPLRLDLRPYRGELVVRSRGGRLSAVNELGLERYLRGVVPWEMPHDWPLQALKAQAVAARSYAIATLHPGQIYDLLDDTRDQVYGGLAAEKPRSTRAVDSTAGRVLWYGNNVATTYYHSTSGGRTAAVWDAWPGTPRIPYLRAVWSPYETASPHYRWPTRVFSAAGLGRKLGVPRPTDAVVERNGSGRPVAVSLAGRRLAAKRVQDALGLRSGWFRLGVLALERPPRAVFGRPLEVSGIARDVAGVGIERRIDGRWRMVARVRPRRSGRFRVPVRALGDEFRIAGGGAAAPPVRISLAPAVEVRTTAGAIAGVVRPALANATVRIQRLGGRRWTTVLSTKVDARGGFRAPEELEPGRYRAWLPAARGFLAGASEPFTR